MVQCRTCLSRCRGNHNRCNRGDQPVRRKVQELLLYSQYFGPKIKGSVADLAPPAELAPPSAGSKVCVCCEVCVRLSEEKLVTDLTNALMLEDPEGLVWSQNALGGPGE